MNIRDNIVTSYTDTPALISGKVPSHTESTAKEGQSRAPSADTVSLTPSAQAQANKANADSPNPANTDNPVTDKSVFSEWNKSYQDKVYTLAQLKTNWLAESERMVEEHYGIKAQGDDTLTVLFNDDPNVGYLAAVSYFPNQDDELSRATDQVLTIVTSKFPQGQDENGAYKPFYGDRTIAHEMTHAIMGQTMDMDALGEWFKEGAAELIHGADERVLYQLSAVNGDLEDGYNDQDVAAFAQDTSFFDQWNNSSEHYAKGYLAVRFMHQDIVSHGGAGIKDVMQFLTDEKMLATGNATVDDALAYLAYQGKSSYGSEQEFKDAFAQQAVTQINNLNLYNEDTGAIGGYDVDNGEIKTAESVVDNTTKSLPSEPLKGYKDVLFQDPNTTYSAYS
ncbi:flagellinolysin [Alteromonas sp. C1M14]|uniref:flagellinolysin n=1 Tax=Alteromonas sp. C1M14 TaxID=2841567 RepID=UPI001C0A3B8D|nr:flagellinolysin [Alteromonas sp. C1M14]MBU2979983.1 flagellinolysin [Alteromonas sp. C1M14]